MNKKKFTLFKQRANTQDLSSFSIQSEEQKKGDDKEEKQKQPAENESIGSKDKIPNDDSSSLKSESNSIYCKCGDNDC